ncbi:hypothetical protein [Solidesulfovibrio magneticus]|uniref:hypothetical protein n=1 Tax=Solidesulfovibrio magneticus TaxID=184917 RepID=UPI00130526F0|nr:hypothetical protein [Solidesulfovibrio magneticus]
MVEDFGQGASRWRQGLSPDNEPQALAAAHDQLRRLVAINGKDVSTDAANGQVVAESA